MRTRVWFEHVALVLAGLMSGALDWVWRADIETLMRIERILKRWLLLRALALFPGRPRARRAHANADYMRQPPPGFRRRLARASLRRRATQSLLPRANGVRARMRRILHVLTHAELYVARVLKRLKRGFKGFRTLRVAPPPLSFASNAPVLAPRAADSS